MPEIKQKTPKAETAAGVDVAHLQYLIRAIVAASDISPSGEGPRINEHVLVDLDLDGVRYLLIRMPAVDAVRTMLSPREFEIVRMVAQGYQNKIIASILNISTWTVCAHVRRVFAKFGVSSRAAMVARLLETDFGLASSVGASTTAGSTIAPRNPAYAMTPRPRGKSEAVPVPPLLEKRSAAAVVTPRATTRSRLARTVAQF